MPIYEYSCQGCGKDTEIIQKFSDARLTTCPQCGGHIERLISASAFVLKGGGWYKDGYANKANTPTETKDTAKDTTKDTVTKGADSPICAQTGKPADTSCACANVVKQ